MTPDTMGTAEVIRGNARDLPLADDSVDLIVTSPPYFALRSYTDDGAHYAGQIGDEATPAEFVDALLEVTTECMRVLKPSGSLWVNLGDKYAGAPSGPQGSSGALAVTGYGDRIGGRRPKVRHAIPNKSLMGIPWRYALRCIDDLGLILRAEVIWSKPNGLPESVTDRVRRSHEQWFHFTLNPHYYSAVDEIREAHSEAWGPIDRIRGHRNVKPDGTPDGGMVERPNPLGKLPGSVWTIDGGESVTRSVLSAVAAGALTIEEGERILWTASCATSSRSPLAVGNGADTAAPTATGRRTSQGEASAGRTEWPTSSMSDPSPTDSPSTTSVGTRVASTPTTSSQSPSQRTSDEPTPNETSAHAGTRSQTPTRSALATGGSPSGAASATPTDRSDVGESVWVVPTEPLRVPEHLGIDHFAAFPSEFPKRIIRGWSPAGGTIVDPFGGTGTTAMVAKALGRHGISVDMSADYCRLAEWRTQDRDQLAKVLDIPKADQEPVDTPSLFDMVDGGAA